MLSTVPDAHNKLKPVRADSNFNSGGDDKNTMSRSKSEITQQHRVGDKRQAQFSSESLQDEVKVFNSKRVLKMASKCEHKDRQHYSTGLCQSCYLAKYYLKRVERKRQKLANLRLAAAEALD